jgi:hypothetical protein
MAVGMRSTDALARRVKYRSDGGVRLWGCGAASALRARARQTLKRARMFIMNGCDSTH